MSDIRSADLVGQPALPAGRASAQLVHPAPGPRAAGSRRPSCPRLRPAAGPRLARSGTASSSVTGPAEQADPRPGQPVRLWPRATMQVGMTSGEAGLRRSACVAGPGGAHPQRGRRGYDRGRTPACTRPHPVGLDDRPPVRGKSVLVNATTGRAASRPGRPARRSPRRSARGRPRRRTAPRRPARRDQRVGTRATGGRASPAAGRAAAVCRSAGGRRRAATGAAPRRRASARPRAARPASGLGERVGQPVRSGTNRSCGPRRPAAAPRPRCAGSGARWAARCAGRRSARGAPVVAGHADRGIDQRVDKLALALLGGADDSTRRSGRAAGRGAARARPQVRGPCLVQVRIVTSRTSSHNGAGPARWPGRRVPSGPADGGGRTRIGPWVRSPSSSIVTLVLSRAWKTQKCSRAPPSTSCPARTGSGAGGSRRRPARSRSRRGGRSPRSRRPRCRRAAGRRPCGPRRSTGTPATRGCLVHPETSRPTGATERPVRPVAALTVAVQGP
jgi:hypothetical protein